VYAVVDSPAAFISANSVVQISYIQPVGCLLTELAAFKTQRSGLYRCFDVVCLRDQLAPDTVMHSRLAGGRARAVAFREICFVVRFSAR